MTVSPTATPAADDRVKPVVAVAAVVRLAGLVADPTLQISRSYYIHPHVNALTNTCLMSAPGLPVLAPGIVEVPRGEAESRRIIAVI